MFPCCFCSEEPVTPRGDRLEQAQSLQVVPSTAKAAAVRGTSLSDNSKSQVEAATIAPGAENTSIAAAGADVTATIVPGAAAPGGTTGTNTTVTVGAVEKGVVEESTTTASATSSSTVAAAANKVEEQKAPPAAKEPPPEPKQDVVEQEKAPPAAKEPPPEPKQDVVEQEKAPPAAKEPPPEPKEGAKTTSEVAASRLATFYSEIVTDVIPKGFEKEFEALSDAKTFKTVADLPIPHEMHAEGEKNPDDLHLRHYLARAKHILVVLPGMKYVELMRHPDVNTECDYVYHLMQDTGLNPASFMGFKLDGEAVVDYILSYARDFESKHPGTKIDGVMAFDCFPTMCASIVNHVLGLQGPSIPSLIMCDCKKEMRKHLTPHVKVYDPVEFYKEALSLEASGADPVEAAKKEGSPYPVVIKGASGQFYMASKTLFNYKEVLKYIRARPTQEGVFNPTSEVGQKLQSISCADAEKADLTSGNDIDETARSMIQYRRRQNFFYKYGGAVGKYDWGVSRPEDLPLFHVEEMFHTFSEQQIEIVVDKDGKMLIADTGDISRSAVVEEAVTVFKTPGSFKIEGALKTFAKDVTEKLIKSFGFKNGALDLEFVRIKDGQGNATEKYELIEYNARYSYMGWHQMEGTNMQSGNMRASAMHTSNAIQEVEAKKSKGKRSTVFEGNDLRRAFLTLNTHKSVRNLKNRTQLCLGLLPSIIPARDEVGESKLAVFAYTKRLGPEDEIIDMPTILQRVIDFDQDPKEMMAKLKAMKGRFAPLEEYVPKTLAVPKTITETDQAYQGYCKHGFFLMTWRDENEAINSALKELVGTFFRQQTDTYLDCVLAMPHSEHPNVEALSN